MSLDTLETEGYDGQVLRPARLDLTFHFLNVLYGWVYNCSNLNCRTYNEFYGMWCAARQDGLIASGVIFDMGQRIARLRRLLDIVGEYYTSSYDEYLARFYTLIYRRHVQPVAHFRELARDIDKSAASDLTREEYESLVSLFTLHEDEVGNEVYCKRSYPPVADVHVLNYINYTSLLQEAWEAAAPNTSPLLHQLILSKTNCAVNQKLISEAEESVIHATLFSVG